MLEHVIKTAYLLSHNAFYVTFDTLYGRKSILLRVKIKNDKNLHTNFKNLHSWRPCFTIGGLANQQYRFCRIESAQSSIIIGVWHFLQAFTHVSSRLMQPKLVLRYNLMNKYSENSQFRKIHQWTSFWLGYPGLCL